MRVYGDRLGLHFTATPHGACCGQFIPVHPGQPYGMARRGFTVGKQFILSGIYAFIGIGSVLLAVVWAGGGQSDFRRDLAGTGGRLASGSVADATSAESAAD